MLKIRKKACKKYYLFCGFLSLWRVTLWLERSCRSSKTTHLSTRQSEVFPKCYNLYTIPVTKTIFSLKWNLFSRPFIWAADELCAINRIWNARVELFFIILSNFESIKVSLIPTDILVQFSHFHFIYIAICPFYVYWRVSYFLILFLVG